MKKTLLVAMRTSIVIFGILLSDAVMADCRCVCMSGEVQAVCSSTLDIQPICSSRICPITPPSIEPSQRSRTPPIGTENCVQRQIYNDHTRRHEWKEVCR